MKLEIPRNFLRIPRNLLSRIGILRNKGVKFHAYWSMDFQAFIAGRLGCEKFLGFPKNSKES